MLGGKNYLVGQKTAVAGPGAGERGFSRTFAA